MSAKSEEALRKKKEAKQKKLLFVLAPVFLLLVVWQGPGYLKMITGGSSAPVAPAAAPATTGTAPSPESGPAPSTALGPEAAANAAAAGALPESDIPLPAGSGQLVSFGRFVGKDPFKQQVSAPKEGGGGATGPGDDPGGTDGPGEGGKVPPTGEDGGGKDDGAGGGGDGGAGEEPGDKPQAARIEVNGLAETVARDGAFPTTDPIFKLVDLDRKTATIGLVAGSFSNGVKTIKLKVDQTVTLVSQPDGLRYTIKLDAILDSAAPDGGAMPGGGTTTAPVETTTTP